MTHFKSVLKIILTVIIIQVHVYGQDGVTLSLNERAIANNGYVEVNDIGSEEYSALLCRTNKAVCCKSSLMKGEWYFPNNESLKNMFNSNNTSPNRYFYRDRTDNMLVRLRRVGDPPQRGRFYCRVPNNNNDIKTLYVNIVDISSVVISSIGPVTQTAGIDVNLTCSVDTSLLMDVSAPTIEWFFGSNNLTLPSNATVLDVTKSDNTYTGTLHFSPLLVSHAGIYTCRVGGNPRLAAKTTIAVNHLTIGFEQSSYSVMEGYELEICIAVQGNATVTAVVTLSTIEDTALNDMDFAAPLDIDLDIIEDTETLSRRCVNIPTMFDDNTLNSDKKLNISLSTTDPVIVIDPDKVVASVIIKNIPPPDITPLRNFVTSGNSVTLTVTHMFSAIAYLWKLNDTDIEGKESNTLTISNVTKNDEGIYTCIVTTTFGVNITSITADIFVFSAAQITHHPSSSAVPQGNQAMFTVEATGDVLTYQWLRNNTNLKQNDSKFEGVRTMTLTVKDVQVGDTGTYRCVVTNGAGDSVTSNEATLTVVIPPSSPTITETKFESNNINISWNKDVTVDHYNIQYNVTILECAGEMNIMQNRSYIISPVITVNTSFYVINGSVNRTEENTNYTISITAVNTEPITVRSEPTITTITTEEAAPSGGPASVSNLTISTTSITIQWERVPCHKRNGEITAYNVTYYPNMYSDAAQRSINVSGVTETNRIFVAHGLLPRTSYTFEVGAINSVGVGPATKERFNTTVPEEVGFFLNGTLYSNNSIVNLEEIGVDNRSLICLTNSLNCCNDTSNGDWYDPDNMTVTENRDDNTTNYYYYTSNGPSMVRLNKIDNAANGQGVFHCIIPDASGNNQRIFVGIYSSDMGIPNSANLTFNVPTLTCTSTGGPATTVTWKKNGQDLNMDGAVYEQNKVITDTQTAEYQSTLILPKRNITDFNSQYECIVENVRGSSNASLTLQALKIIENDTFILGEPAALTCTSIISVDELVWLDHEGIVLVNVSSKNTSAMSADLTFNQVNDSIHNKTFTCGAERKGTVEKDIFVSVSAPLYPVINVTINTSQDDPVVIVGDQFKLTCVVHVIEGFTQEPAVVWRHPNGSEINDSSIEFNPVRASDGGNYTCNGMLVSPLFDMPRITGDILFTLTIKLPPPNVSIHHPVGTLYAGSSVNITYEVSLINEVDIDVLVEVTCHSGRGTVVKNGSNLSPKSDSDYTNNFTSFLTLSPLSARDINISCTANISPVNNALYIMESPSGSAIIQLLNINNPSVNVNITPSSNGHQSVGSQFNIACATRGFDHLNPRFDIQWGKISGMIDDSPQVNASLSFSSLRLSDAGEYTCEVNVTSDYLVNGYTTGMGNYNLSITIPSPTVNVSVMKPMDIFIGSNLTLICTITLGMQLAMAGPLEVSVKWSGPIEIENSTVLLSNRDSETLVYSTQLSFNSVSLNIFGNYSCEAKVMVTNSPYLLPSSPASDSIEVNIIPDPHAPILTILRPLDSTTVEIEWAKGDTIDQVYEVAIQYMYQGPCSCKEENSKLCILMNVSDTSNSTYHYNIPSLQEGSVYTFRVIASNPSGLSAPTEMNVTTLPAAPSDSPQSLNIATFNLTSISIQWREVECFERNSDIIGYTITFDQTTENVSSTKREFTAPRLFPSTTYTFLIAAISSNGTGPFRNISGSTSSPNEVSLLLNGQLLLNNSVITWMDFGSGSGYLFCLTDIVDCCDSASDSGNWYFPNGSIVTSDHSTSMGVYQKYGHSSILLQNQGDTSAVSGIFRCEVIDSSGIDQNLYIGIYSESRNQASLNTVFFSLKDDVNIKFDLNCSSEGGPISQMLWLVDGTVIDDSTPFPILADAEEGLYYSTLHRHGRLVGNYSCVIELTDENNVKSNMTQSYYVQALQPPSDVNAVWIYDVEIFHICWMTSDSGRLQASLYRVLSGDKTVLYQNASLSNEKIAANVTNKYNNRDFTIQALLETALPSELLPVNVSAAGVSLLHNGRNVENGSVLSIDSIGESYDMSLICKTNKTKCCRSYSHRFGEWYSPNGTIVPKNESDYRFYRTRSDDSEVFLHQRSSNQASSSMVGVYCCEVPDTDENCDVTQRLCVNLASLVVDMIGLNVAGENYSLSCTSAVGSERMDDPTFEWSGPNGTIHLTSNSLADSGIMLENTNTLDTFTSMLKFGPLQASHRGNYTCIVTFQGNSESSSFIVNVLAPEINIRFSKNNQLNIGQSYNLTCSVAGAEKLNANIAYQLTKDNGTGTFVIADANYFEFQIFRLSNTGSYTCKVDISSNYLDGIIRESNTTKLSVEMPDPDSIIVQSIGTQDRPLFLPNGVVTNTTLNCTVTLNANIDIPVTVKTMWVGPDGFSCTKVAAMDVGDTYFSQVIVSDLNISNAGEYECTAIVNSSPASIFVTGEGRKSSDTTLALFNITIEDKMLSYQVGDVVNISCTVTTGGTDERPMIYWNGLNVSTSNNLNFNPLMASQAGTYFCHASLSSSEGKESISISAELDVDLSVHPNVSGPVMAGDRISMLCVAKIDKTLVDVNVSVELHLIGPRRVNTTIKNSNLDVFVLSISFSSITAEDSGDFCCNVTVNAASTQQFLKPISNETNHDLILIPSEPTVNKSAFVVQKNSITITWSQTPGDRVDHYLIDHTYQDRCNDSLQPSWINRIPDGERRVTLGNLEEYSEYLVTVTAVNIEGSSSTNLTIRTLSSAPTGEPSNVAESIITSTSIHLVWEDVNCLDRNGIITNYTLHYQPNIMNYTATSLSVTTVNNFLTVTNLIPRTSYTFQVAANNINGTGPNTSITVTTNPVEKVTLFHNGSFQANNSIITIDEIGTGEMAVLCFTDKLECCDNGPNRSGEWYFPNGSAVRIIGEGDNIYRDRGPSVVRLNQRRNFSYSAYGLYCCQIPDINMNVSIYVYIGLYSNGKGKPTVESLAFDANQQSLICISANGPASNVTWNRYGKNLTIDGIKYSQVQQVENTSKSMYINTLLIRDLEPDEVAGNYTCIVSNVRGNAQQSLEIRDIRVTGHESALPHGSSISLNCTTDLAVDKIEWLNTEGSIIKTGNDSILELIVTDTDTEGVKYTCRITSAFGNQTKNITLKVLSEPASSNMVSSAVSAIVVAIVMAVLVTVLIIIVFVIVRRKRQGRFVFFSSKVKSKPHPGLVVLSGPLHGNKDDVIDNDKIEMSTFGKGKLDTYRGGVVSITDFGKHVKKMHDDRDEPFETEYASISKDPQNSYAIADIVVNRFKNRFANIFPYDYNRVKLKDLAGAENSNYINASYMDGYEKPKGYIAAQGPLPNTLEDYWRMVWENRLTTIVMLTQCFEGRKKCECYWPENINCTFEPGQGIEVILTSMTPFAEYTVRKMTVTKSTEPNVLPLEVVQFHFLAWPDHGVPNNCAVMLNFVRRVRKLHPYSNPCPLLVHCSAGVGRTGTFIVLDSMLERMKTEDTLNVYDFVKKLRTQRVLMVQSLAQYIFIHDALKEVISCGQTEILAADMRMVINQLNMQSDPCSASTGFEHQFQVLCQMPCVTEDNCYSNATSEHNKPKNRYHNRLPNNFYRVRLKSTATPGSDYINASFIDGYRQKNTYIATQGPLESTVCDFWRMVWEKESKCVVLLSKLTEEDKEMCFLYWPLTVGNVQRYGQITVKMLSEDNYGDYNLRKFEINEDKTGVVGVKTAFTVTQFHFLVWPEHETPPITSSLIELMDDVNKVQMRSGNRPMIVMCNDGVGRTGTFICIHAQLERLKTEGVVDFFQFIKSARLHRAGLVSDVTQYVLCHDVVANYLDSFDTYANFKEVV